MFAVPGWSISAKSLKTETESSRPEADKGNSSSLPMRNENKSKKRKRGSDAHSGKKVTSENLDELWKQHVQSDAPLEQVNGTSDKSESRKIQSKKERKKALKNADTSSKFEASAASGIQEADGAANTETNSNKEETGFTKYKKRKAKAKQRHEERSFKPVGSGTEPQEDQTPLESKRASTSAFEATKTSPASKATPENANVSKPSIQDISTTDEVKQKGSDSSKSTIISTPAAPPNPKLTPLQQRMAQKLVSARFRHLNETLYSSPSTKSMALFTSSPQAYGAYHAGFRAQVAIWPSNPVDQFVQQIRERGAVRPPFRNGHRNDKRFGGKKNFRDKAKPAPPSGGAPAGPEPLQRHPTTHICHIIDLGCGDAALAASLCTPGQQNTRLKLSIRSFDLAQGDGPHASLVSVADITDLRAAGVADASVNLAICCLSLMSTNWVRVVDECARVVRGGGGEVWVAEIRSRFVAQRGQKRRHPGTPLLPRGASAAAEKGAKKHRSRRDADEDDQEEEEYFSDLEDRANTGSAAGATAADAGASATDVSSFVDVWRRRGFTLKGDPDVSNKMFVTMRFVKERWSTAAAAGAEGLNGGDGMEKGDDDEAEVEQEGKVLKPCLYKTR